MIMKAPLREGYAYREPSDYDGIWHLYKKNPAGESVSGDKLYNRIKGAWYGRVCGCLLGKPIEGFMSDEIRLLLEGTGNWPMKTYIYQKAITEEVIRAGLNEIPVTSRLYESVMQVLAWNQEGKTYDEVIGKICEVYDEKNIHHWDHTISNVIFVAAALLYGEGKFDRSICYAVQIGFDMDCNGATVGSIVGMMKGYDHIPGEWTQPLHGELDTDIFRVGKVSLEDMVQRTIRHIGQENK